MKILSTLFLCFTLAAQAQTTYGNNPATGKYYDINGFKMYTEVYGSGPPLLMIEGNAGTMKEFEKIVPTSPPTTRSSSPTAARRANPSTPTIP